MSGHTVKVGWFTSEIDPHKLLLLSYGTGRFDLLVVPPGTGAESAARLLAAASDHDGPVTAGALIAAEAARHAVSPTDQALDPDEASEYEGGTSAVSAAVTGQTGPPGPASRLIIGMCGGRHERLPYGPRFPGPRRSGGVPDPPARPPARRQDRGVPVQHPRPGRRGRGAPQPHPAPWVGIRASDRPPGRPAPPPTRPAATRGRGVDAGSGAPEDPSIRTEAS